MKLTSFVSMVLSFGLVARARSQSFDNSSFSDEGPIKDAPLSILQSVIEATVECPNGITGQEGGVVLLIHGTGGTGKGSWRNGPFTEILPNLKPKFDVCYINLPNRANTDIQITSEYVAGNIEQLARKSKNGKVALIGHSQGAVNIQWALTFWPSTRQYVSHFVAIAGDFKGSDKGVEQCQKTSKKNNGKCTPALTQLTSTSSENKYSNFINALNKYGGKELVPTTSIYTLKDDVTQPETGEKATSVLQGANNVYLQDSRICGHSSKADHFSILSDPATLALTYGALTGQQQKDFDHSYCRSYIGMNAFGTFQKIAKSFPIGFYNIVKLGDSLNQYATVTTEPKLLPYVCQSGSAPADQCE